VTTARSRDPPPRTATGRPRGSILLVHDRPADLETMESILAPILGPIGHRLVKVRSGREALAQLGRHDFALVLVDEEMAAGAGAETAAAVREQARDRHVPVVVTAFARGAALAQHDDFLSAASHELRTPLTSLKLELANLARLVHRGETVADERVAAKVAKIEGQADRLHRLIDGLLDVSRIASGRLDLLLEEVDLAEIALDVGHRLRAEAARAGCPLRVRAQGPIIGRWDHARLEQVAVNLASNALKYGAGKPVEIAATAAGRRGRLWVRDHGVGIDPHDQARIFERFERAASVRHVGGIGVGLWVVKHIVDGLGGTISVESQLGAGSTFTVELPLAPPNGSSARYRIHSHS
jgi:signal transduction histidine kinase